MPGITVHEPLNPTSWTREQQQEVFDNLAVILGITPGCDYGSMSDEELSRSLRDLTDEMKSRPAAETSLQEVIKFYEDVIVSPIEGLAQYGKGSPNRKK